MDKYDFEMNKLKIEKAAVELFSKKSYGSVTMDEVAKSSELTKRTVYKYFPSKAALVASIFESYLKRLNDEISQTALKELAPENALIEITATLFRYTNENPGFMKMFWMLSTDELDGEIPSELRQRIKLWNKSIFDQTVDIAKSKNIQGFFANYPPDIISHLISAINKGIFIHANKEKTLDISDIGNEKLQEVFINLLKYALNTVD